MPVCRTILFGISIISLASASAASAQQRDSAAGNVTQVGEDNPEPSDIIVTAQRRSENLLDVPISISAFSSETLEERGISDVQDLQIAVPGIVVNNTGPIFAPYIRGIGTRLSNGGLEPSIATYIDDRYVANAKFSNRDFSEIERVEVLKGPQGTLFGRNATGGAVRLISKDVGNEFGGYVTAEYGTYNHIALAAAANIPVSDGFGIRIYGASRDRDGIAKNLVGTPARSALNDINDHSLGFRAKWHISPDATLRFGASYWAKKDNEGAALIDISPPGLSRPITVLGAITGNSAKNVATSMTLPSDGREYAAFVKFDYAFGNVNFTSVTNVDDQRFFLTFDGDGTSARASDIYTFEKASSLQQEFRLASNTDGPIDWIVGLYGYRYKIDFIAAIDTGSATLLDASGDQIAKTKAGAIFGQATWTISPALSLTLGGRYSVENKRVLNFATQPSRRFPQIATSAALLARLPYSDEHVWRKFTPKATVQYDFGPGMIYATYARGFKSGGYNPPAATSPRLNPETLDMFELGLKGQLADRTLSYDISLFHYKYHDLQVTRSVDGTIVSTENAANAKLSGADLSINWTPTRHFSIAAGGSMVDSEYQDYFAAVRIFNPGPGTVSTGFLADGSPLLNSPKWSGYISPRLVVDAGRGSIPISLTYSFKSAFFYDFVVQPQMRAARSGGYGILNGRIAYEAPEGWQVAFWAKNITNRRLFNDVTPIASGIRASLADPRTLGVQFRYDF